MNSLFLEESLNNLQTKGLKRTLRSVCGTQSHKIIIDGKKTLNFCSNNYLGLADDPRLRKAAVVCIDKEGLGSGASRLVCGNMRAHRALEEKIAAFKGVENCLVFSTGYMANVGIISSFFERGDLVLCDKRNHASIIDGVILSGAKFKRYRHSDMGHLEELLKKGGHFKKRGIITDSVFSMDGDIASLDEIVDLAKEYNAIVMIDEAHAFGVFGEKGKGLAEHFGLEKEIDIQMGTLSKAVGSFGAYCCGSKTLIDFLVNRARSFIYTTGMPPAICAASVAAIEIIERDKTLRQRLWENTDYLRGALQEIGFNTLKSTSPIIPVLVKDNNLAVEFSKKLFNEGVFVQAIRPPTVPANTARLRVTVMATHSKENLDYAIGKFQQIGKELCLI